MNIDKQLIDKYNRPVPRYTSYPPANHFLADFRENQYLELIKASNRSRAKNLAFYIHVPFCTQICYYCGCNAVKKHKNTDIDAYFSALTTEITRVCSGIDPERTISQIHFGGGTPNAVEMHYLEKIINLLLQKFKLIDRPEIAIECHPALLDNGKIDHLSTIGFNRFSLGVQDFNEEVLRAVNRRPPRQSVEDLVSRIRSREAKVNLDFIYGLPLQTPRNFAQSIKKAIEMRPERLVTFSYAHVPWLKKQQKLLAEKALPSPEEKMQMFENARKQMLAAAYKAIGLDHFALPDDELSRALDQKQLHRNFQGYCTRRTTGQVYAFGVSAISQLEGGYSQNTKSIDNYINALKKGQLPTEKGLVLSAEQTIIREVINQLMCNRYVHWGDLAKRLTLSPERLKEIINYSAERLRPLSDDGLLQFDDNHLRISEVGGLLMRNIAALFDPMYAKNNKPYAKLV